MREGYNKPSKKSESASPWAVEEGSAIDILGKNQKKESELEGKTLAEFRAELKELSKNDDITYEVEENAGALEFSADAEQYSQFIGHIAALLQSKNQTLKSEGQPFHIHLTVRGAHHIRLTIEKTRV